MRLRYFVYLILVAIVLGFVVSLYYLVTVIMYTETDIFLNEFTQTDKQEVPVNDEELTYSAFNDGTFITCWL